MTALHRILAALVPGATSEWIKAHAAELDAIEDPKSRQLWALGVVPFATSALVNQLRTNPRSYIGGTLVRTIVATVSAVNLLTGSILTVIYVATDDQSPMMLIVGAALVAQGAYTIAVLAGSFKSWTRRAVTLQVVGSTLALGVGLLGFSASLVVNTIATNGDPEFGPMVVAALLGAHALASLLTFVDPGERTTHIA